MSVAAAPSGLLRFSTDHIPERDRFPIWREVVGRNLMRLDIDRMADHPFYAGGIVRALPGLGAQWYATSGASVQRTPELMADGNDAVCIGLTTAGCYTASQLGVEREVPTGDVAVMSAGDWGRIAFGPKAQFAALYVPRTVLKTMAPGVEDTFMRPIAREPFKLLASYMNVLRDEQELTSPELQQAVVTHVYDLVALALGASRDAAAMAQGRGVAAARLNAIKVDILRHLGDGGLSIGAVAARQGVTPRYVAMLFEAAGMKYTEFVTQQRLAWAYRALANPRHTGVTISAIAFESGFGDVSYFNRSFRRRYGGTPSDVRAIGVAGLLKS